MNNDELITRTPASGKSPRIMVLGELLPESAYTAASEITPEDIEEIREDWLKTAPPSFQNLLDAEME